MLKSIAINVGIDVNNLSRFKGGMEYLKKSEVETLAEYLNEVVIPQWSKIKKTEKKTLSKLDVLRKKMKK